MRRRAGVAGRHSFGLDDYFVLQLSGLRWLHPWRPCSLEALRKFTNKLPPVHTHSVVLLRAAQRALSSRMEAEEKVL